MRVFLFCSLFPVAGCLLFSGCGGRGSGTPIAQPQVTLKKTVQVALGYDHACALLSDGTVKCWGDNGSGILGNGITSGPENCGSDTVFLSCSTKPLVVPGINTAMKISVGADFACALLSDGLIKCWGANGFGTLGVDPKTTYISSTPVTVTGINNAISVSAGMEHTCAVLSDKTVKCWGFNGDGELGNGTTTNSWHPVTVNGISNAAEISSGVFHSCALLSDGAVTCWGANDGGQVNGTTTNNGPEFCNSHSCSMIPLAVPEIKNVQKIVAGQSNSCVLLTNKTVTCWGGPDFGVSALSDVKSLSVREIHLCATLESGNIKCSGFNFYGEFGDGTFNPTLGSTTFSTFVNSSGINNAVEIATGFNTTCAILADGFLRCWGKNNMGQLGIGTNKGTETCQDNTPCSTVPVPVDSSLYAAAPRVLKNFYFAFAELLMRLTPG